MRGKISGKKLFLKLKRQDFVQLFCFWETVILLSGSGSGTGNKTFPKSEPEPQQIITVPQHWFCMPILYIKLQERPYKCNICGRSYSQSGKTYPISNVKIISNEDFRAFCRTVELFLYYVLTKKFAPVFFEISNLHSLVIYSTGIYLYKAPTPSVHC